MAKRTFKGDSPKNARIKIDYSGVKPNVRFSYPSKPEQFEGSMFGVVFVAWVIPFMILFSLPISDNLKHDYMKTESGSTDIYIECLYDYRNSTLNFTQAQEVCDENLEPFGFLLWAIGFFIVFLTPPIIINKIFKKKLANIYPKYQAFMQRKKYTKLDNSDVDWTKNRGWYVEVPVFTNVILDYTATEDFSKHLKYFEIHEHKFRYMYKENKKLSTNPKTRKKQQKHRKKRRLNEWIWYARFYFDKKPQRGYIEVIFK
jgi:hypothetical protein